MCSSCVSEVKRLAACVVEGYVCWRDVCVVGTSVRLCVYVWMYVWVWSCKRAHCKLFLLLSHDAAPDFRNADSGKNSAKIRMEIWELKDGEMQLDRTALPKMRYSSIPFAHRLPRPGV